MKQKISKDCFAYKKKQCTALKSIKCDGCSFYKTISENRKGREKAIARILTLDKGTRESIINTYYGGKLEVKE